MPQSLPPAFSPVGEASFAEFLSQHRPDLLSRLATGPSSVDAPHGTTIVAATWADGVVMAGDRRATMGNVIAQRCIEKVFAADDHACIGIAGSAGIAIELVRLFQVELEHYEKIEGSSLSLDGKANRLSTMLRSNLGLAMQGLAAVPLLAGYDLARSTGRIFSYDVTGGRYEEHDFYSVGSGSVFARGSLKKLSATSWARPRRSRSAWRRCTTQPTTTRRPVGRTSPAGSSRSWRWWMPPGSDVSIRTS